MTGWLEDPFWYGWLQHSVCRSGMRRWFVGRYMRPAENQRVLDLGCGTGQVLDVLPKLDYWGLDLNERYIEHARKKWGTRANFRCADLCRTPWPVEGRFDRAIAFGLLHHLSDEQALGVLKTARSHLKPGATLVTIDGCFEPGQSPIARLFLTMDRGKYVRARQKYESLARSVFKDVRPHLETKLLRIPYTHLIMQMSD